jgi:hypothetical protein
MEVLDELGAGGPQRHGPGGGVALGVAGVIEDVAGRDPLAGHRGQHRGEGADRVVAARRQRRAANEFGDGGPGLFAHHDPGREIVAVKQFVLGAQQVVLAVSPGRLRIGAVAGAVRRGREKDSRSVQSTAIEVLASASVSGMEASSRASQMRCSRPAGSPPGWSSSPAPARRELPP